MSKFLETELNDETIKKIAQHCTFDNLKNVESFDLMLRLKQMDNSIAFKIIRVSFKISFHADYGDFKLFNSNIKTIARKNGGFMVSGKVGGWRSKLTISQGQFRIKIRDISTRD